MANGAAQLIIDQGDRPQTSQMLRGLHDPGGQRAVCWMTPGPRTLENLANDVLRALGKRADLGGVSPTSTESWARVQAWVAGEALEELVVARAQLLPRERWEQLITLSSLTGARLWLVVQGAPLTRGQSEAARDWGLTTSSLKVLRRRLRTGYATVAPEPHEPFPTAPVDEFPTFRAACRKLLSAEEFARVDAELRSTFAAVDGWLRQTPRENQVQFEENLLDHLASLLRSCHDLQQALVRCRAAQVACFAHGTLMKVDRDGLAGGYASGPTGQLDPAGARRLRQYGETRYAALGVIALVSRLPPRRLAELNLDSLAPEGTAVTVAGRRLGVPAFAAGILRTHRLYRIWRGATSEEPLFVSQGREKRGWKGQGLTRTNPKGIQRQLGKVARETGIPVATREGGFDNDEGRWMRRRGITIHDLRG